MSDSGVFGGSNLPRWRNKYHRRGPRACDECRLRKRKCGSLRPCGPCISTGHSCTYQIQTPSLNPTQRIRYLEDELRNTQITLKQFQSAGINAGVVQILSAADRLEHEPSPESCVYTSSKSVADGQSVENMVGSSGFLINRFPNSGAFFGASSIVSFIRRTLQFFLKGSERVPSTLKIDSAMLHLFDNPFPEKLRLQTHHINLQRLPERATALCILDSLFTKCTLIAQFLDYGDVWKVVDRVYRSMIQRHESYHQETVLLVHSLLALGYLYYAPVHRAQGCGAAIDDALLHFSTARGALDMTQRNDLGSLQSLLCIIAFLISTCRIAAAHPYIGVAYSSAMRLGLHCPELGASNLSHQQRQSRKRTLIAILKFDIYSSLILGLPPFADLHSPLLNFDVPRCDHLCRQISDFSEEQHETVQIELSLKQLELLRITASGLDIVFPKPATSSDEKSREISPPVNVKSLEEVQNKFKQWAESCSTIAKCMGDSPTDDVFKHELEINYYFDQIIVYQPFLHYLKRMADGEALSSLETQQALACIKISSVIITRAEEMMRRGLICPASWMLIYSVFVAVICLAFLVSAHKGTSKPLKAWKKARNGIRLLAAARCRNDCATACLRILKNFTAELSHTVDFDIEQIEGSSTRLCQHILTPDPGAENGGATTLDQQWTTFTRNADSPFAMRDSSIVDSTKSCQHDTATRLSGEAESSIPIARPYDADEILAQAQGIRLGRGMEYFMDPTGFAQD